MVHTGWLHEYEILESANDLYKSRSVVAEGRKMERREQLQKYLNFSSLLDVMDMFIILISDKFTGIYI